MKFETVHKIMPNNEFVAIREASIDDAQELLNVVKEYVEESEFIPYEKGEFQNSLEEEEKWIHSFQESPNSLLLVAEVQGKIVGNLTLNSSPRKQLQHTAEVGIGILKRFRGNKIGRNLFDAAIEWAKRDSGLEFLTLKTASENYIGLNLYKSIGFKEIGILPKEIKLADNSYMDTITMTMRIK